jgi:hypothetical protein
VHDTGTDALNSSFAVGLYVTFVVRFVAIWVMLEMFEMVGGTVPTVKFLVAEMLVRLAASVQETFQLWFPVPRPE